MPLKFDIPNSSKSNNCFFYWRKKLVGCEGIRLERGDEESDFILFLKN